jgi:hypothetical protein
VAGSGAGSRGQHSPAEPGPPRRPTTTQPHRPGHQPSGRTTRAGRSWPPRVTSGRSFSTTPARPSTCSTSRPRPGPAATPPVSTRGLPSSPTAIHAPATATGEAAGHRAARGRYEPGHLRRTPALLLRTRGQARGEVPRRVPERRHLVRRPARRPARAVTAAELLACAPARHRILADDAMGPSALFRPSPHAYLSMQGRR